MYVSVLEVVWSEDKKLIVKRVYDSESLEKTEVRATHEDLAPLVELLENVIPSILKIYHNSCSIENPVERISATLSALMSKIFSKEVLMKIVAWVFAKRKLGGIKRVMMNVNSAYARVIASVDLVNNAVAVECADDELKNIASELCRKILKKEDIFAILEVFSSMILVCLIPREIRKNVWRKLKLLLL